MNARLASLRIIVCINTCEKDIDSLRMIEQTDWYRKYHAFENIEMFAVIGGQSVDGEYEFRDNTLYLKTPESYRNLSVKTFHMFKAVHETFHDYDYLVKLDSTIISTEKTKWDHRYGFPNFVREFENNFFVHDYEGVLRITNNAISDVERWAGMSGLDVRLDKVFGEATGLQLPTEYWAGKCYTLSRNLVAKLVERRTLFYLFREFAGGCEDLCVATALSNP